MDPVASPSMSSGMSKSTKIMIAVVIVLVIAAAAYYYFCVYKPAHSTGKEGYHNYFGQKAPIEDAQWNVGCPGPQQSMANGCLMECAQMPNGLPHTDCMYRCMGEPSRTTPGNSCPSCQ